MDELSDSTVGSRRKTGFGGGTFFTGSVYSGISLQLVGDRSMYLSGSGTAMAFSGAPVLLPVLLPLFDFRISGKFRDVPGCGCRLLAPMLFPMAYGVMSVRVLSESKYKINMMPLDG